LLPVSLEIRRVLPHLDPRHGYPTTIVSLLVFAPGSRPLLEELAPQLGAQKRAFLLAVHPWRQPWD
jgi:hypothetical protein